jgi:hypothetical protein
VVYSIFKIGAVQGGRVKDFSAPSLSERARQFSAPAKTMDAGSGSFSGFRPPMAGSASGTTGGKTPPARQDAVRPKAKDASGHKVGRNDPCPCGAVKPDGTPVKYKHCHGK